VLEALDRLEPGTPRVALKVFVGGGQAGAGRDTLVRFEREVQIAALLDAPSVLRPRALLPDGPTLVLPFMGGGSLDALAGRGPLPARRAAEIVDRVLAALEAAHRRGIVHRDVKPSNVLLDEVGGAYLTDFGVAHLGDAGATATAGVLGTVRYMAPEQRRGEPATPESDVYAVGVVLGELLGVEEAWPAPVRALLHRLTAEERAARPTAGEARSAIAALAWPDEPFSARRAPSLRPVVASGRFVDDGPDVEDTLLGRRERLVPLTSPVVAALLASDDPALPRLLGRRGDQARIEVVTGPSRPVEAGPSAVVARLAAHGVAVTGFVETSRGLVAALES
jgi:serine/threonine protein kinase